MGRFPKRIVPFVVAALLVGSADVEAQRNQRWRTPDGDLYLGDTPPAGSEPIDRLEPEGPSGTRGAPDEPVGGAPGAGRAMGRSTSSTPLDRGFGIERVSFGQGEARALVRFRNVTDVSLDQVRFDCTAMDEGGREIATGSAGFSSAREGPIDPGFRGTREVRIDLGDRKLKSLDCRVTLTAR